MRVDHLLITAMLLSPAAIAQNIIEIHPGVTNFTSRGSIGNNATGGDILQGLHTAAFTGIGDNGVRATVSAFSMVLQDQNTDTQEQYNIVYRSGDDANGPATGAAGIICSFGPFTSPPRGAGGKIQAWRITENFGTVSCLDLCSMNAFGLDLQKPPQRWSGDGISVHMSRGDGAFAQSVQSAASGAPDMAWQIIDRGAGEVVTHPSIHRSWRFRLITPAATLQMGNGGSKYGQGGPNPDTGVAFSARARYGSGASGATSWLFLGTNNTCPGFSLFPGMRTYIGGAIVGPFLQSVGTSGAAIHLLGTTPATSPNVTLHFQAAAISTSGLVGITNAAASDL